MVRPVVLSRFSLLNGLVQRHVGFSSSSIQSCPVLTDAFSDNVSHSSSQSSNFDSSSNPSPSIGPSVPVSIEKASLETAAAARREYEKQKTLLRKKYAAEVAEKQKREQKDEEMVRARVAELKEQRLQLKKERSAARAVEVEQESKILQEHMKEQKTINITARNKLEARQGLIRHKRILAVRRQSSMWIEEKDLERRILEAISNPFHLRGSISSGPVDRDDSYYEADEA